MPRQSDDNSQRSVSAEASAARDQRELELVEAHRMGDASALGQLLQSYQRRVYAICYRMLRDADEAADLTQDTLVRLVENLDKYDGRAKLSTWIIRIAMNACISYLRKKKVRLAGEGRIRDAAAASFVGDEYGGVASGQYAEQSVPGRVERDERLAALDAALMSLDEDMRAVLVLRDMHGLEYEQLAEALEIPIGTVKSRIFRARAALRNALAQYENG